MKTLGLIPLIRANGFGSLPKLLQERVSERVLLTILKDEGLPLATRELGDMPIPARSLVGLFARGAPLLGDRTLGFQIGKDMSYKGFGPWGLQSAKMPNLHGAILRLHATSQMHEASGLKFELSRESTHWIWRVARPSYLEGSMHYSDHQIMPMIDYARLFLGPCWWPEWVEVDYERDKEAGYLERALKTRVRFHCKGVGIALTREEVLHEGPPQAEPSPALISPPRDLYEDVILPDAPEPVRSFSAVVALRLIDGESDLDGAARISGVSVQGLQRQLRQSGYSYREVLEVARQKRAIHLLTKTTMSVADIGASLGYDEHSNFTRAFGRWFQHPPSAFRQRHHQVSL